MIPVPSAILHRDADGYTIDADFLAPRLGLTTPALKAAMREGFVYSTTEMGVDADAGRTRLTFRHRAKSVIIQIEPDGSLFDVSGRP